MKKEISITLLFLALTLVYPMLSFADGYPQQTTEETQTTETETTQTTTTISNTDKEVTIIDENQTKVTTKFFDLLLIRKNQSAIFGYVPYELQITPHLDSSKTQILWYVPTTLTVSPKHNEFISMEGGKTYTVRANIKPLREGSYEITASVISWQHDTNYANTINDTLTFDESLVLQPSSTQYKVMSVVKYILLVIAIIGACFGISKIIKKFMPQIRQWFTPPY